MTLVSSISPLTYPHRTTRRTLQPYHSPARGQSLSFVMPRYEPTRAPRVCGPGPLHREMHV